MQKALPGNENRRISKVFTEIKSGEAERKRKLAYKRLGWTEKTRVEYYGQTLTVMEICLSSS